MAKRKKIVPFVAAVAATSVAMGGVGVPAAVADVDAPRVAANTHITLPTEHRGGKEPFVAFVQTRVRNTAAGYGALVTNPLPSFGPKVLSTLNYPAVPASSSGAGKTNVALGTTNDSHGGVDFSASTEADISSVSVLSAERSVIDTGVAGRKFDTRANGGSLVGAGGVYTYKSGRPNTTLFGNLAVTGAVNNGWVVAYGCADGRPATSHINFKKGVTKSNLVMVKSDAKGDVCFYTTAATHLLWDEQGASTALQASPARRVLDTRPSGFKVNYLVGDSRTIKTGVPNGVVFGNLTVFGTAAHGGDVEAFSVDRAYYGRPGVDILKDNDVNENIFNSFVALPTNEKGEAYVTGVDVHLIFDQVAVVSTVTGPLAGKLAPSGLKGGNKAPRNDSQNLFMMSHIPDISEPSAVVPGVTVNLFSKNISVVRGESLTVMLPRQVEPNETIAVKVATGSQSPQDFVLIDSKTHNIVRPDLSGRAYYSNTGSSPVSLSMLWNSDVDATGAAVLVSILTPTAGQTWPPSPTIDMYPMQ